VAPTPPTREPRQFIAGDTILWTKQLADYPPADGWLLHYKLVGPSTLAADITAVDDGGTFDVTIPAAATGFGGFIAGTYRMIGYVDGVGAERHTIYRADVEILPNVAAVSYANLRTHDEKMLAAIQAALEGRSSADIEQSMPTGKHGRCRPTSRSGTSSACLRAGRAISRATIRGLPVSSTRSRTTSSARTASCCRPR
jgi:hypothetical protein